jgi:membrane fusion protein (multidrug efflux system)
MTHAFYRRGSLFTGAALLAFALVSSCKEKEEKAPPPPPIVKVSEAVKRDVPLFTEAIGQTRGNKEIEISARVEGFLETMTFKEGSFVKKGQVLYTLDPRPFQASLAEARATLAQAQADLVRKQQDVARYKPLVEKSAVSVQEYETAVALERAQQSSVAAAQAAVQKAQVELSYTTVVAPDDGLIGITEAHPGTLVGGTQKAQLTQISKIDPIHVRFSIAERDYLFFARRRAAANEVASAGAARVKNAPAAAGGGPTPGQPELEFQLVLADGSIHPHLGKLVFIDRNVDPTTGTIRVEAAFPNPEGIVRPGQYARVRAATTEKKDAVLISQNSVQEIQGLFNVAVVKPDNSVEIRPIKPGERVGALMIAESGVTPGEKLVVEGLQRIRPGIKVQPEVVPLEDSTTPAPGGPAPRAADGG